MLIGLDFDNTIVCYSSAISIMAEKLFTLPPEVPRTKIGLRDYLRLQNRESEWTTFQGELYGPGMQYAEPFQDAVETIQHLAAAGHNLVIVSHRSRRPYAGQPYDLHASAHDWVENRLNKARLFGKDKIIFSETLQGKIAMIAQLCCDVFLDDLPEVLLSSDFPKTTKGILFFPSNDFVLNLTGLQQVRKWSHLPDLLARIK